MRRSRDPGRALVPALVVHDAAVLLAVFYAPIFWGGFGASGLTMAAALISIAALSALVWRSAALRAGPAVIPNAIHLPALLFLVVTAVTALFSANSHSSALELCRLATGFVLFLLVANRALLPPAPALPVAVLVAASLGVLPFVHASGEAGPSLDLLTALAGVCVCAFLLVHRRSPDPVRRWTEALVLSAGLSLGLFGIREKLFTYYLLKNRTWEIFGTFFNQNELAGFLALAIPVALAVVLAPQRLWRRLLSGVAACAMLVAILPTNSKGAYLALSLALALFVLLLAAVRERPRRNLMVVLGLYALLAAAALALLVVSPGVRAKVTGAFGAQSASNMFRILTWQGTLAMARHHLWVGIGPGAFKSVYMNYAVVGYTEAAHETYLQVLAEQGVFGAITFLWLLGAILVTGARALRRPGAAWADRVLAAGGLCGIIALLAHSLLDYGWYIGATGLTAWFLAGMLAHISHGRAPAVATAPAESDPPKGRRRRIAEPPRVPPVEAGTVRVLPWPRRAGGRVLAMASLVCLLALLIEVPARNALAQDAMARGDAAMSQVETLQSQGDLPSAAVEYREGLACYQEAVAADPGWPEAYERLGPYRKGAEGEQLLRRAAALDASSFQPFLSLARVYDQTGRWPEAAAAYQQALARFPRDARVLRLLAQVYHHRGPEGKALDTYRRIVALQSQPIYRYPAITQDVDVNYAFAHYELGRAELQSSGAGPSVRQLQTAARQFTECLSIIADYFAPHRGYAIDQMFLQAGKPRASRAEELLPLKAKALWRLAEVYDRLGRHRLAMAQRNDAVAAVSGVAQLTAAEDRERVP